MPFTNQDISWHWWLEAATKLKEFLQVVLADHGLLYWGHKLTAFPYSSNQNCAPLYALCVCTCQLLHYETDRMITTIITSEQDLIWLALSPLSFLYCFWP